MLGSLFPPISSRLGLLLAGMLTVLGGCNNSEFDLAPAAGKVTLDGEPFAWGSVMFSPVAESGELESGKPAFGMLTGDGSFELTTYTNNDGAVIGEHWVSIYCIDDGPNGPPPTSLPKFRRLLLKEKTYPVVAGKENEFVFDITKEDLRKHAVD